MAEQCCVDGCLSHKEELTYFKLPISRVLRKKWLDAIQSTFKLTDDALVCNKHFPEDDYVTVRGKKRLKPKVVPSLFHNNKKKRDSHENENTNKTTSDNENSSKVDVTENITENQNTEAIDKDKNTDVKSESIDKVAESAESIDNKEDATDNKKIADKSKEVSNGTENKKERTEEQTNTQRPEIEDIEEILTNYHIKLIRRCELSKTEIDIQTHQSGTEMERALAAGVLAAKEIDKAMDVGEKETIDVDNMAETKYVEVAVKGKNEERDEDCLLLLESVQVEVDPSLFEHDETLDQVDTLDHVDLDLESDSDVVDLGEKKDPPISLLSSSDDDDVIIEEPVFSTVEVSDATDEDDIPLQKLAKTTKKTKKLKKKKDPKSAAISKIVSFYKYQCYHCKYTTNDTADYDSHMDTHSNVLHCCETCSYTTSSLMLLTRHKEKHYREKHKERKKYKCPLCTYTAKHNMSLVYHMSTHESRVTHESAKSAFECDKCGMLSNSKAAVLRHVKVCGKKYTCARCSFVSRWKWSLKKHVERCHGLEDEKEKENE